MRSLCSGAVREDARAANLLGERFFEQRIELGAGEHALAALQAELRDRRRGRGVVAGDHLHRDAGAAALRAIASTASGRGDR